VDQPSGLLTDLCQKSASVITEANLLPVVATAHGMVMGTWRLDSDGTGHEWLASGECSDGKQKRYKVRPDHLFWWKQTGKSLRGRSNA